MSAPGKNLKFEILNFNSNLNFKYLNIKNCFKIKNLKFKISHGFTLIELLITLSIIAIISAIGLASYQAILKNARDAKRKSDLRSIQSALEQYRADNFHYPLVGNGVCEVNNGKFIFGCPLKNITGTKNYLNKISNDPLNDPLLTSSATYEYIPFTTAINLICDDANVAQCFNYCLYAKMENDAGNPESILAGNCPGPVLSTEHNYRLNKP